MLVTGLKPKRAWPVPEWVNFLDGLFNTPNVVIIFVKKNLVGSVSQTVNKPVE